MPNSAHLHLLLNHFPVIGTAGVLIFLLYAFASKNEKLKKFSLLVIILISLITNNLTNALNLSNLSTTLGIQNSEFVYLGYRTILEFNNSFQIHKFVHARGRDPVAAG